MENRTGNWLRRVGLFTGFGSWLMVLALGHVLSPSTARADDATKKQKLEQLLTEMRIWDATKMQAMMITRFAVGPDKRIPMAKKQKDINAIVNGIPEKKIHETALNAYSDAFDEGDIDQLLAFCNSPVGQKFMHTRQEVMRKTMSSLDDLLKPEFKKVTHLEPEDREFKLPSPPPNNGPGPDRDQPPAGG